MLITTVQGAAAYAALCGLIWAAWDRKSGSAALLMALGLAVLVASEVLS